jgi:hypothetical protein
VAAVFAACGDRVAVHYGSSREAAERTLASLPGEGHQLARADLADPSAIHRMVDGMASALGGIDVLVNNAGLYTPHAITEVSYEAVAARLARHIRGEHVRRGERDLVRGALYEGRGRWTDRQCVLPGAFRGQPNQPAYGASKAALIAFGQSLARTLGPSRICHHRRAGVDRYGHGRERARGRGRRATAAGKPPWSGRDSGRGGSGRGVPSFRRRGVRNRRGAGLQRRLPSPSLTVEAGNPDGAPCGLVVGTTTPVRRSPLMSVRVRLRPHGWRLGGRPGRRRCRWLGSGMMSVPRAVRPRRNRINWFPPAWRITS